MAREPRLRSAIALLAVLAAGFVGVPGHAQTLKPATLPLGEYYFRVDGTPRFLLGRNPTGWQTTQFEPLLRWAHDSGEKMVRIHLTAGMPPHGQAGQVDEAWAKSWEQVFDMAAANGLYVLPVFGVWSDWNDGSGGVAYHRWDKNDYNAALGGPAQTPAELLGRTTCRRQWLAWMGTLVRRWSGRPEIMGWEVFSELDLLTGAREDDAVDFMTSAAGIIRMADPQQRPVTASLAGISEWPKLFASDAIDIVQVHPYANMPPYKGDLSGLLLDCVRQRLSRYRKPVMIGESGLESGAPQGSLATSPGAHIEINHTLWAAMVSGAANGRMLWYEDGYDQYSGLDLRTAYKEASAPAARFAADIDFTDFKPVAAEMTDGVKGAALGNARCVIAWFKDAHCVPPEWPVRRVTEQLVTLNVPGTATNWRLDFYDPRSGTLTASANVARADNRVDVLLPSFEDSIALKLTATAQGG